MGWEHDTVREHFILRHGQVELDIDKFKRAPVPLSTKAEEHMLEMYYELIFNCRTRQELIDCLKRFEGNNMIKSEIDVIKSKFL